MIRDVFDRSAQIYDRARRQLVPCFDDFYEALVDQLPPADSAKLRVLDLGAGTGLLSLFVAERFPAAQLILLDASPEMLQRARHRFTAWPGRFEFVVADFSNGLPAGKFDAVVSALAIHHLADDAKRTLFGRVHDVLVDGGVFIDADQVCGETPEIEAGYRRTWLRQVRARGVSDDDLAAALERMEEDRMASLASHLHWLRDAGFQSVDCWYRSYNFAVFGGCKARA
jgi:tRNA (cmo5U34)-methyltransferase